MDTWSLNKLIKKPRTGVVDGDTYFLDIRVILLSFAKIRPSYLFCRTLTNALLHRVPFRLGSG